MIYLPFAKFAYNSTTLIHGYSPFHSIYEWQPITLNVIDNSKFGSPAAEEWLEYITLVQSQISNTLKKFNDRRSHLSLDKVQKFKVHD